MPVVYAVGVIIGKYGKYADAPPPSAASAALVATGLAAPVVTAWLFWRDGGWDTYRAPLFLPFLFAAGLMVRFSLSPMTVDPRSWRSFVARAAAGAAAVAAGAGIVAARNRLPACTPATSSRSRCWPARWSRRPASQPGWASASAPARGSRRHGASRRVS